jgi:D-alanine-D-alanine ligase-like ATP-grasp enzyme
LLLPAKLIDEIDGFVIVLAKKCYYFRGGETPFNDHCSANIAANKYFTSKILQLAGIPVPKLTGIHKYEFEAGKLEEKLLGCKFPVVIKPVDGSQGGGVLCNIKNIDQLKNYLATLFSTYKSLLIEEFHANLKSYRVLVFNRRVIGVILRYPAQVIGDGKHNIKQLIELTNSRRKKLNDALGKIIVDEECHIRFKELKIGLDYVPKQNEQVFLGYTSNASRGGSFESLGRQICKENRRLMVRAAEVLNLTLVGLDVECTDINLPIETSQGVIIEANHCPSIKIHEFPMSGIATPVTKKIIRSIIYQHPLAYLCVLYTNKKTVFYARSLILVIFLALLYKFL